MTTDKRTALLPCPFCDNTDIAFRSNGIGDYYCICSTDEDTGEGCGARTSDVHCEGKEYAAERWNTRADVVNEWLHGIDTDGYRTDGERAAARCLIDMLAPQAHSKSQLKRLVTQGAIPAAPKADHEAAREVSKRLENTYVELENLKVAYLERDRQYRELRDAVKAAADKMAAQYRRSIRPAVCVVAAWEEALRAALRDDHE